MNADLTKAKELRQIGDLAGAERHLKTLIKQGNATAEVLYAYGSLLNQLDRYKEAIQYLRLATEASPNNPNYWYSFGNSLNQEEAYPEAIHAYNRSLSLNKNDIPTLVNLTLVHQKLGNYSKSESLARRAIDLEPLQKNSWLALISALEGGRNYESAILAVDEALAKFVDDTKLLTWKGDLLTKSDKFGEALLVYKQALQQEPNSTYILNSIGYVLQFKHPYESLRFHQQALELNPDDPDALMGMGTGFLKVGSPTDAVPYFLESLQKGGNSAGLYDNLLLAAQYLESVDETQLFELHQEWAELFAKPRYPKSDDLPKLNNDVRNGSRPIRLAFISPDFRDHSISRFISCLLMHANDSGLDIYCYSDVIHANETSSYLESLGGIWRKTIDLPDHELMRLIRKDGIDVLVDLSGHTSFNRLPLFAAKPAPLQISWLGYPNTTGLNTIDYRFSDVIADPVGQSDKLSTEKIVRLENGFHCFQPPIELPPVSKLPSLNGGPITFGSFNNQSKINALTVDRWAMLLNAIPDSKLLLKNSKLSIENTKKHWLKVFTDLGISPDRLEFIGFCENLTDHFACYQRVDIALDTFPYNGTTTTCEALWMGVPVITIPGETQRARTAASLLTHAGLNDWVVDSESDWVERALYWSNNRTELNELRQKLRGQVSASPIGDAQQFAEKFFTKVQQLVKK